MLLDLRQVKTLTKSFLDRDEDRFFAVFLRLAQREADTGNEKSAEKLKDIVQRARLEMRSLTRSPDASPKRNGAGLHILDVSYPKYRLSDISLNEDIRLQLLSLIEEQRDFNGLRRRGQKITTKCLLQGNPTKSDEHLIPMVLAGELGLPMYRVHLERLLERKHEDQLLGLEQVFKVIAAIRGIYLFDDLDLVTTTTESDGQTREPSRQWLETLVEMIAKDYWGSLLLFVTSSPALIQHDLSQLMDAVFLIEQAELSLRAAKSCSWRLAPNSTESDPLIG